MIVDIHDGSVFDPEAPARDTRLFSREASKPQGIAIRDFEKTLDSVLEQNGLGAWVGNYAISDEQKNVVGNHITAFTVTLSYGGKDLTLEYP